METTEIKDTENKIGFKIDYDKWKADLDSILAEREKERASTEKKYWAAVDYRYDEQLTKLYSIRAHARGRIHRKYAKLNEYEYRKLGHKTPGWQEFMANNGVIKFTLTLDDQTAYIGDSWMDYEKK